MNAPLDLDAVNRPVLPARYAGCASWEEISRALAADLLLLRSYPYTLCWIAGFVARLVASAELTAARQAGRGVA